MIRMQTHQYICTERSNVFCKQRVSKIDHPSPWLIPSRGHYQVTEVTSINVQIRLRIFLVKVSYPSRPSRNPENKIFWQRTFPKKLSILPFHVLFILYNSHISRFKKCLGAILLFLPTWGRTVRPFFPGRYNILCETSRTHIFPKLLSLVLYLSPTPCSF